jgi:hypothetical protein
VTGRARILACVRHPGPAHCLAAAIAAAPEGEWHIAAHASVVKLLVESYADVTAGANLIVLPFDEVDEPDTAQLRAGLAHCAQLVGDVRPDAVLRTTPSTGWWADEFIATAVAGRAPVIALQDFPGLGTALAAGTYSAIERSVDAALAPDDTSAGWLRTHAGVPTTSVGWLAHDRFHRMRPYDDQRAESRLAAGLAVGHVGVLVIGSGPDVPLPEERRLFAQATGIIDALHAVRVSVGYRPHPRRSVADTSGLQGALHDGLTETAELRFDQLEPGLAGLSAADIVVSRASVMNLELVAYAATWDSQHPPMSVYLLEGERFSVAGYWGPTTPTTHLTGGGSLVVGAMIGDAVAHELATGRQLTSDALARAYVSDPNRTSAVMRPLLLGTAG